MSDDDVWLLDQATIRRPPVQPDSPVRYNDAAQMSLVEIDGRPALAVEARGGAPTKKADIEKAEDQKDRWRP
jgi:hypothetical protein